MVIYQATKTLEAIDKMLESDQGATYRGFLGKVIPHMGDAFSTDSSPFRTHLGASMIGRECPREIWYGFRWVTRKKVTSRMLRLFNRGHLEEARFIALLLGIGCKVYQQDENGNQYRISDHGGHFGGSGDGIVIGCPDLPQGQPCVSEFKTHNDKSFAKLCKEGVAVAKPEHYVQMQVYMRKMGLAAALYMATNKNDDTIWAEIVPLDTVVADAYINRGGELVYMTQAPKRISNSPSWYKCKFCDHYPVCHQGQEPDRNCRTCQFASPQPTGGWACSRHNTMLTKEQQFVGCQSYEKWSALNDPS